MALFYAVISLGVVREIRVVTGQQHVTKQACRNNVKTTTADSFAFLQLRESSGFYNF